MERQFTISRLLQYVIAFLFSLIFYAMLSLLPAFTRFFIWLLLLGSAIWNVIPNKRNAISWLVGISLIMIYLILVFYPLEIGPQLFPPFWNTGFLSVSDVRIVLNKIMIFLQPTVIELLVIAFILIVGIFSGKVVFRSILKKIPNYYFEFISFVGPQTAKKVIQLNILLFQQLVVSLVFALAAFYLLGIKTFYSFALLFGMFSLIPYFGLFLGGIFVILLLPVSDNLVFQIVGIVISAAVIWLVRFILLHNKQKNIQLDLHFLVYPIIIFSNYLLLGLRGVLFLTPLYLLFFIIIQSLAVSAPLLHHPNNLLRKILLT